RPRRQFALDGAHHSPHPPTHPITSEILAGRLGVFTSRTPPQAASPSATVRAGRRSPLTSPTCSSHNF
ncbi:MAG TPA: hypothetical protein VE054_03835, partial [Blattabacteriaceae bacterium]|nr:hypothetical protein [Blattabacteriaceae bacterium]